MGGNLSTVQELVRQKYVERNNDKGFLNLRDMLAISLPYGIDTSHIGVLWAIDRNHDGQFSLEELLDFTQFAHAQIKTSPTRDAGFLVMGYCSLLMWSTLEEAGGRQRFVDWTARLYSQGQHTRTFKGSPGMCVHIKALKSVHHLFDLGRNQGIDLETLKDMLLSAASQLRMTDANDADEQQEWVPLEVLNMFSEHMFDGMSGIMESFFDRSELADVLEVSSAGLGAAVNDPNGLLQG
eukprot:jgi/Chrzof1/10980/Cz05g19130.t1